MDTITHAISGAVLGAALPERGMRGLARRSRALAGGLAAAFPDCDFVIGFFADPLTYLNLHRGLTHSLVLLPLWAPLLGWLLARLWKRPECWRVFTLLAAAALLAHIGGDVITSYGTRVFAPLSWRAVAFPITFIIDPVFTGILLTGLILALWRRSAPAARAAGLLLLAYLGLQTAARQEALEVARAEAAAWPGEQQVTVLPQPLSPLHWKLVLADGQAYRQAWLALGAEQVRGAGPDAPLPARIWALYRPADHLRWQEHSAPTAPEHSDFIHAAWGRPEFAGFREFAGLPYLYGISRDEQARCAWFSDLRFQIEGLSPPFRYGMCLDGEGNWALARLGRW